MIIFFSGNVGSGKTTLAKYIARRFNFFYLEADKYKKEIYSERDDSKMFFVQGKPVPSAVRARLYNRLTFEIARLSKTQKNIILDETLHTRLGRAKLLKTGKKYFKHSLVIYIKSPLNLIKKRGIKNRAGHLLKNTYKMHLSIKNTAQFIQKPNLVIYNKDLKNSKNILTSYINNLTHKLES